MDLAANVGSAELTVVNSVSGLLLGTEFGVLCFTAVAVFFAKPDMACNDDGTGIGGWADGRPGLAGSTVRSQYRF